MKLRALVVVALVSSAITLTAADELASPEPRGSFYWGGAFGTWFWIDPVNDMIVVGMIQNVAGSQTAAGNPAVREMSAQAAYAAMTDRR